MPSSSIRFLAPGCAAQNPSGKSGRKTLLLFCAVAIFALPWHALARPEMAEQNSAARFAAMDTDKDGRVSREEFFAAQPNMKEAAFDAIDTNKDGFIDIKEWEGFAVGHSSSPAEEAHPQKENTTPPKSGNEAAPELVMPPPTNK